MEVLHIFYGNFNFRDISDTILILPKSILTFMKEQPEIRLTHLNHLVLANIISVMLLCKHMKIIPSSTTGKEYILL